jgi:hypothetical protein
MFQLQQENKREYWRQRIRVCEYILEGVSRAIFIAPPVT